jgi:hypothetical protein
MADEKKTENTLAGTFDFSHSEISEELKTSQADKKLGIQSFLDSKWSVVKRMNNAYSNIINLPYSFNNNADPSDRVFINTILKDLFIVNIAPGRPSFNILATDSKYEQNKKSFEDYKTQFKQEPTNASGIADFIGKNVGSLPDFRYYTFQYDWGTYYQYLQTMCSYTWTRMRLERGPFAFHVADALNAYGNAENGMLNLHSVFGWAGISFAADYKGSSVTESASNNFQDSAVASAVKSFSQISKEIQFLLGVDKNDTANKLRNASEGKAASKEDTGLIGATTSTLEGLGGMLDGIFGYMGEGPIETIVNGTQFMFPEVWSDSTFTKDYTLSFRFHAPYGDPYVVFHTVLFPYFALLTLTLPQQRGPSNYLAPFLIRLEAPGWFRINCGVITSLTITKGGQDNLWTSNGLPMQIDVNVTVKDLYPAMMISQSYGELAVNTGLMDTLDTIAGLRVSSFNLKENIKTAVASMTSIYGNTVENLKSGIRTKLTNNDGKLIQWIQSNLISIWG